MIKKHFTSDDLREMIAKKLHRESDEIQETSRNDGFMSTWFDVGHDECPIYIPIIDFLAGYLDVDRDAIKLSWDPYNWTYSAEVFYA